MDGRKNIIFSAIFANEQLFRLLFSETLENSDKEEELAEVFLLEAHLRLHGPSKKSVRIEGYVENIIPRFNTKQFREHYRMLPSTFALLENHLDLFWQGILVINLAYLFVRNCLLHCGY